MHEIAAIDLMIQDMETQKNKTRYYSKRRKIFTLVPLENPEFVTNRDDYENNGAKLIAALNAFERSALEGWEIEED